MWNPPKSDFHRGCGFKFSCLSLTPVRRRLWGLSRARKIDGSPNRPFPIVYSIALIWTLFSFLIDDIKSLSSLFISMRRSFVRRLSSCAYFVLLPWRMGVLPPCLEQRREGRMGAFLQGEPFLVRAPQEREIKFRVGFHGVCHFWRLSST